MSIIRLLYLSLVLILKVTSSLKVNECRTLASVCKRDPWCVDDKAFFLKCVHKYVLDDNSFITDKAVSTTWDWNPSDSTQVLQKRILKTIIPGLFDKRSYSDYEQQEPIAEKSPKELKTDRISRVLDIYRAYKKESLRESLEEDIKENHESEIPVKKTLFYRATRKFFSDIENTESVEKNKILVHDAVHLLNKIIHRKEFSDSDQTKLNKDTFDRNNPSTVKVKKVFLNKNKLISESTTLYSKDREEVAVPVFVRSDVEPDTTSKDPSDTQEDKGYLTLKAAKSLTNSEAEALVGKLQEFLWNIKVADHKIFTLENLNQNAVKYHMVTQPTWFESVDDASTVVNKLDEDLKNKIKAATGITVTSASSQVPLGKSAPIKVAPNKTWDRLTLLTAIIGGCTLALVVVALIVCSVKKRGKDTPVAFKRQEAVEDYQELCRTQMSVVNSQPEEDDIEKENTMRNAWNDDTFPYNMDITTGHVILAYMEDHLKNEDRLNKEWEALCSYKVDNGEKNIGADSRNTSKNRYADVLPYDTNRVKLHELTNAYHSDYVNASFITDANPRKPEYIATQGPLEKTTADFWQMVWEQGIVVIVNLTKLSDLGLPQCHRYWPEDGSEVYHIYEVHLISEHIWCDDYLVRSLYLKNLQTGETRTITQFHFLAWPDLDIPNSTKPLLEFRRKVNKCYRGNACPIIVHCNNGVGRTGTYILLDMVLNKMIKGTKEIDMAATLEHLRDQRPDMVKTKGQFEFALTAVAEEVTVILTAVPK